MEDLETLIEAKLENQILKSLSESGVGGNDFGGLWQADKEEESGDAVIVRCVVNPLTYVDGKIYKSNVEIALAVRKECDTDGTLFSLNCKKLSDILNGWQTNYKSASDSISIDEFKVCPQITKGSDGKIEITSSPVSNLTTEADWDGNSDVSILKCVFTLCGVIM